jgi:hypothetical protein
LRRSIILRAQESSARSTLPFGPGKARSPLVDMIEVRLVTFNRGLKPLNLVVFGRSPNAGMGSLYRSQHELLPLFKNSSARS